MKKNISFLFIIFFTSFSLSAQEITYKTVENCFSIETGIPLFADNSVYYDLDSYIKYEKNTLLTFVIDERTEIYADDFTGYDNDDTIASLIICNSDGERRKYSVDYLRLTKFDELPGFSTDTTKDYPKTGLLLLPQKYYRVLNKNSVKELFKEEPYWENGYYENLDNNRYDSWTEIFYPASLYISNSYFTIYRSDCDHDQQLHDMSGLITSMKRINSNKYRIDFFNSINDDYSYPVDETFKLLNSKNTHFFLLEYDGDYVNVFLDSEDNLVDSFVISSDFIRTKLFELAKNGKTTTSNITWPRHADGTCDYDDEIKPPVTQHSDNDFVTEEEEAATPSDTFSENEEDVKTVEEKVSSVKKSSSLPLVIIVASVAILLLFIVIILIVRKKKRQ